jgi:hypothetical protein
MILQLFQVQQFTNEKYCFILWNVLDLNDGISQDFSPSWYCDAIYIVLDVIVTSPSQHIFKKWEIKMLTLDAHYNTKHYILEDMGKSYWSIFQV